MTQGLYGPLSDALLDMFSVNPNSFSWQGTTYNCVLNANSGTLSAYKSDFGNRSYPNRGDTILVEGETQQVTSISNSTSAFIDGGIIDTSTGFTDDPTDPVLTIGYRPFINK